jgi:chemotaxis protein CheX
VTDGVLELPPLHEEDIIAITAQVWSSFLGVELSAVPPQDAELVGPVLVAQVRMTGAWNGRVLLRCSAAHAAAAAVCMFSTSPGAASDLEARDALGELANVVAGNVKSLLPAPSALSMPVVTAVEPPAGEGVPGAGAAHHVAFVAPAGGLHVIVWEEATT